MRLTLHSARSLMRKKFKRPADNLLIQTSEGAMGIRGDPKGWERRIFEETTDMELARTGHMYGQLKMYLVHMELVPDQVSEPGTPVSLRFRPVSTVVYLASEEGWLDPLGKLLTVSV